MPTVNKHISTQLLNEPSHPRPLGLLQSCTSNCPTKAKKVMCLKQPDTLPLLAKHPRPCFIGILKNIYIAKLRKKQIFGTKWRKNVISDKFAIQKKCKQKSMSSCTYCAFHVLVQPNFRRYNFNFLPDQAQTHLDYLNVLHKLWC